MGREVVSCGCESLKMEDDSELVRLEPEHISFLRRQATINSELPTSCWVLKSGLAALANNRYAIRLPPLLLQNSIGHPQRSSC